MKNLEIGNTERFMHEKMQVNQNGLEIKNPKMRVVEYLKYKNRDNGKAIAGEYFGNKFTYDKTFQMFEDYKKAFLSLEGKKENGVLIAAPSIISSVNAFYGAIDASKIACPIGPGFLNAFPEKYVKENECETVFIFDAFLNEDLINKLAQVGVKNVVVTSIADYMSPVVKAVAISTGQVSKHDFLDSYVKSGKKLPQGMQFIRAKDFAKVGSKIKEETNFPYEEGKIAAHFLTGATTSQTPKNVQAYADGLNIMGEIYDKLWFDFGPGDRNTVFIPLFYGTGAIHGVHAGLFSGMTNIYKPKYDRFAFAKDLLDSKANLCIVAPSHVFTLENCGLPDGALSDVKYIFIGGEAVTPEQMRKARTIAKRLGIKYIIDGYGMTETACMNGLSLKEILSDDDVTIAPVPGVEYRIVDKNTGEILGDNERGILEVRSGCATAGYTEEEKNKGLFTADGWIHSGDVAVRLENGRYKVFGRGTDYFKNNGQEYAMFDIEEEILKHPGISEAEVIKFKVNNEEYPAAVVVLSKEWQTRLPEVLSYIENLQQPGAEYLVGTRFIDNFKTNPITAKRDYMSLPNEKSGYFKVSNGEFWQFSLTEDNQPEVSIISPSDLKIFENTKEKVLKK